MPPPWSAADYLPFGPLQSLSFAGGAAQSFAHDQNYWTEGVTGTALALDFDLDATGNIVAANDPSPTDARSYSYDPLARLTGIDDGNATLVEAFTYDGTGNRLSKQTNLGTEAYTYPPTSHRLTAVGAQSRSFDAMGNMTARGSDVFVYDDRQRLSGVSATTYAYNARGERVKKTVSGATTLYAYDEAGHLIAELDAGTTPPTPQRSYVWMDDRPVAVYVHTGAYANEWLHIHTDHLGTPRAITRPAASNATVWRWDFHGSAFGDHAPLTDPDGDSLNFAFNLRFPGQYFDAESGLHYNYFRDYEAGIGRYIESDPIGLVAGIATFRYAADNPLAFTDIYGLSENRGIPLPPDWLPGGPYQPSGTGNQFMGPKQPSGPRAVCEYVPENFRNSPNYPNEPYWKVKLPGQDWQRFRNGAAISVEEAHPGNQPRRPGGAGGVRAVGPALLIFHLLSLKECREGTTPQCFCVLQAEMLGEDSSKCMPCDTCGA